MVNNRFPAGVSALLLMLLIGSAEAAITTRVLSFDDASCQAWSRSREVPEQRREYVSWVRGFLSGHNYANPKQAVSDVSRGTIEQYVERFCRDQPKAEFIEAAFRMSDDYSGRGAPIGK